LLLGSSSVSIGVGFLRLRLLAQAINLSDVNGSVAPSFCAAVFVCEFLVETIAQRDETAWVCP